MLNKYHKNVWGAATGATQNATQQNTTTLPQLFEKQLQKKRPPFLNGTKLNHDYFG